MKTRFFSTYPQGNEREDFIRNFVNLMKLDASDRNKFFAELPSILKLHEDDREESIDRLSVDMSIDISQTASLIDWAYHIIRFRADTDFAKDKPSDWAEDILALLRESPVAGEIGPDKAGDVATEVATRIWQIAEDIKPEYSRQWFARGILPKFQDIASTVEMRAVIEDSFSYLKTNRDDLSASDYYPSIIDLVAIASVRINTDTDAHFDFQMNERDLKLAIRSLMATLRELQALRECVNLVKEDRPLGTS